MCDAMKPHCLPCPYKPVLQKRNVEELTGEAKEQALEELFGATEVGAIEAKEQALEELFGATEVGAIERSLRLAQYGPQWRH